METELDWMSQTSERFALGRALRHSYITDLSLNIWLRKQPSLSFMGMITRYHINAETCLILKDLHCIILQSYILLVFPPVHPPCNLYFLSGSTVSWLGCIDSRCGQHLGDGPSLPIGSSLHHWGWCRRRRTGWRSGVGGRGQPGRQDEEWVADSRVCPGGWRWLWHRVRGCGCCNHL